MNGNVRRGFVVKGEQSDAFLRDFYKLRHMLKMLLPQFVSEDTIKMEPNLQVYLSACQTPAKLKSILSALTAQGIYTVGAEQVSGGWKLALAYDELGALVLSKGFRALSELTGVDIAFVDATPVPSLEAPGILFMDMDSTLIQCECIDEIADFLGIKAEISAITQSAMEGHLDFSESLVARVKLLAGLDEPILKQVYDERIQLTEGAEHLIEAVHAAGWKVGLVSGGFTYFTNLLQKRLNLDFTCANTLEIVDGKLTGRVLGDICDGKMKRDLLISQSKVWAIDLAHSVALGDGANDLPMLNTAGLGIAFHAKPKVREDAPYALSSGGLDQTLHLLKPFRGLDA